MAFGIAAVDCAASPSCCLLHGGRDPNLEGKELCCTAWMLGAAEPAELEVAELALDLRALAASFSSMDGP